MIDCRYIPANMLITNALEEINKLIGTIKK